jgi:HAD superfamily hydrolase (TIGR01509 family)
VTTAPVELVVFDCDGVLVDSEKLAVRVDSRVLADMGWPLTEAEIVERFVGRSDAYMRDEIGRQLGCVLADGWDDEYRQWYLDAFERELEAVDGIEEALAAIEAAGVPTCVASSGTHEKMRMTLGRVGLYERFAGRIFSVTEVERGKPEPDLFLHSAQAMGVDPAACAVVEDSRFGVDAALAAGMRAFAYVGGLTKPAMVEHATVVFDELRDLPRLLGLVEHSRGEPGDAGRNR